MPSKKSYFNAPLFCKNLSRFWPLWGGASLLGALLPLALLMTLLSPYNFPSALDAEEVAYGLYSVAATVMPVLSLFYAVLVARTMWGWLYSARSVGFMHALPLHRRTIFFTNTLSGLAMMLIPYLVTGSLTCLILLCFRILPLLAVLQTAAAAVGYTLFYYATATLAAMVTSNLVAMPVFYFIGHFFVEVLYWLLSFLAGSFIFGYVDLGATPLDFLSPTVAFYRYLSVGTAYTEAGEQQAVFNGLWIIWAYALAGLALYAFSLLLYRLRHSESAGEVVAYRPLKPVFRYGVAVCAALTLGQVLYQLLWGEPLQRTLYANLLPMTVCMVAAGLVGYYTASMLLSRSYKVFRRSGKGAAGAAALVCLLCLCAGFDVFGIGRYVPEEAQLSGVFLSVEDNELDVSSGDPRMAEILALQRSILDSEGEIRAYDLLANREADPGQEDDVCYLRIDYYLKNGKTFSRRYRLPIRRERWRQPGDSYENRLDALLNTPQAALDRIAAPANGRLSSITLETYGDPYIYSDSLLEGVMNRVYEALCRDARAGRFPGFEPFGEPEAKTGQPAAETVYLSCVLRLEYSSEWVDGFGETRVQYSYQSLNLTSGMADTLQALLDAGLLTAGQLEALLPDYANAGPLVETA